MVTDAPPIPPSLPPLPLTALANANGLVLRELAERMGVTLRALAEAQRRGIPPRGYEAGGVGRPIIVTLDTIAAALRLDVEAVEAALAPLCDKWRQRTAADIGRKHTRALKRRERAREHLARRIMEIR